MVPVVLPFAAPGGGHEGCSYRPRTRSGLYRSQCSVRGKRTREAALQGPVPERGHGCVAASVLPVHRGGIRQHPRIPRRFGTPPHVFALVQSRTARRRHGKDAPESGL